LSNKNIGEPTIRDSYWLIKIDTHSHPEELMMELTTKCNYDCIYCFRRRLINEKLGDMDYKLALKVIDEASSIGVKKISFSGWGEPLIHPRVLDILSYAKKKGLTILLNTNGYFLQDYPDKLYNIGLDELVVSMDSPYPETYQLIRIGGDLARLVKALLRLKNYKIRDESEKPRLSIQFTINKYNYKNILPMVKLAKELGASTIVVSNIIPITRELEKITCYMNPECIHEVEKLKMEIARISLDTGVEVSLPNFNGSYSERFCPFIRSKALFIRRDGLIAPCIYYAHHWKNVLFGVEREIYPIILGDLRRESLKNIWLRSNLMFRFNTHYMNYPSCLDCPLQEYCTLTLNNLSDCWGNSPTCAHCPYSRDMVRCPL
jgi:tungsten cofactor oxidoreducase radical SAM maturase